MALTDGLILKVGPLVELRSEVKLTSQVANIIVFALSLGSNVYGVAGPEDMYGSSKTTYITPSYYVSCFKSSAESRGAKCDRLSTCGLSSTCSSSEPRFISSPSAARPS
jgi:hypothetical protein